MGKMQDAEWREFVNQGTRTGKLATVRDDGRPHVVPVWFLLDGDELVFTTEANTTKGKSLQRDPRLTMCVDNDAPPFAFAMMEAKASLSEDMDDLLHWSTRLAARYMGEDQAEKYGKMYTVPGVFLVRAKITKVVAYVL